MNFAHCDILADKQFSTDMDNSGLDGLAFLVIFGGMGAIYVGYPLIAVLIGVFVRRKTSLKAGGLKATLIGVVTAILIIAIPFADYPSKRLKVNDYCEREGGFHFFKTVSGVLGVHGLKSGVDEGYMYGEAYDDWLVKDPATLRRFYKAPPDSKRGRYIEEKTEIVSPYGWTREFLMVDETIEKVTNKTYVTATGEVLGNFVYFRNLTSVDKRPSINDLRFWMRMSCGSIKDDNDVPAVHELLKRTLIPATVDEWQSDSAGRSLPTRQ